MKLQITLITIIFSFLLNASSFSKEKIKADEKIKTEKELRKECIELIKKSKSDADRMLAIELLAGCQEKKSFKLLEKMLKFKKDMLTIAVLNALGSCDDSTDIPRQIFILNLNNKQNNILVRGIAAKKLSTRTIKTPVLEALFACIKRLSLVNKVKTRKIGNSGNLNNPDTNDENTPEQNAAAETIRRNIQEMNDVKSINPDNVNLTKLDAALLLADTCMKSIHSLTKQKQFIIKGRSITWWNEGKNKTKAAKWWKKNKAAYKKEDALFIKNLIAKQKEEKAKEEEEAKEKDK